LLLGREGESVIAEVEHCGRGRSESREVGARDLEIEIFHIVTRAGRVAGLANVDGAAAGEVDRELVVLGKARFAGLAPKCEEQALG